MGVRLSCGAPVFASILLVAVRSSPRGSCLQLGPRIPGLVSQDLEQRRRILPELWSPQSPQGVTRFRACVRAMRRGPDTQCESPASALQVGWSEGRGRLP